MASLRVALRLSSLSKENKGSKKKEEKQLIVPATPKLQSALSARQVVREGIQLPLEVSTKVVEWLEAASVSRWAMVNRAWQSLCFEHWQYVHVSLSQSAPRALCRNVAFTKEEEDQPWVHEHNYRCEACGLGGEILMCDFCNVVYHLGCLDPPMSEAPQGLWRCPACLRDKKAPVIGSVAAALIPGLGLVCTGGYELSSFTANRGLYLISKTSINENSWTRLPVRGDPGNDFCSQSAFYMQGLKAFIVFLRRRPEDSSSAAIQPPPVTTSRRRNTVNPTLRTWRRNASLAGATRYNTVFCLRLDEEEEGASWSSQALTGDIPEPRVDAVLCDDGHGRLLLSGGFSNDANRYFQGLFILDLDHYSWRCIHPDRDIDEAALPDTSEEKFTESDTPAPIQVNTQDPTQLDRGPLSVAFNLRPKISAAPRFEFFEKKTDQKAKAKPKKRSIRRKPSLPLNAPGPRAGHAAARTSTRLWFFGGMARRPDGSMGYDDQVWTLDTDTFLWSRQRCRGASPRARAGHSMITVNSHLLVFGGLNAKAFLNDLAVLHMPTRTWSRPTTPLIPSPRMRPALVHLSSSPTAFVTPNTTSDDDDADLSIPQTIASRIILFGGSRAWGLSAYAPTATEQHDGDLYELALLPPSSSSSSSSPPQKRIVKN